MSKNPSSILNVAFRAWACLLLASTLCLGAGYSYAFDSKGQDFRDTNETYILNPANDISLTFTSLLTTGIGTFLYYQMRIPAENEIRDQKDLFPWDRGVAGRYSETADLMSDIGALLAVTPVVMGAYAWNNGTSTGTQFGTFTLMFVQSILFQSGINLAFRSMELWPRPYIYATEGKGYEKAQNAKAEAYGSFFSGHASAAFTVATFTSAWYAEIYPNSPYKSIVTAVSYSLAGFESALRIAAGKHYPTDILVGALMGTGISFGILEMHKKCNQIYSLYAGPGTVGIAFNL